jgi:hypothetical protein
MQFVGKIARSPPKEQNVKGTNPLGRRVTDISW